MGNMIFGLILLAVAATAFLKAGGNDFVGSASKQLKDIFVNGKPASVTKDKERNPEDV